MVPGDVLLFHAPKPNLMQRLIWLTTGSRYNHAAIAVSPFHYAEATDRGVVVSEVGTSSDEVTVVPMSWDDDEDRLTAVAWARARVGTRYGYWQAFMCGLNNVLVGVGLVVKRTDAIICSELVAECLVRAGDERITKDPALVSPGDLATALGLPR